MQLSSRIFSELERALIDNLRFSFDGLSLRELRMLRVGDPVRFAVRLDNLTGLPLREIHGTVRPGDRTRFTESPFSVDQLAPDQTVTIAHVAGVFNGPVDASLVDRGMAKLAVSSRIDLSGIVFEEWDRSVIVSPEMSNRELPLPQQRRRRPLVGTGLPLSTR